MSVCLFVCVCNLCQRLEQESWRLLVEECVAKIWVFFWFSFFLVIQPTMLSGWVSSGRVCGCCWWQVTGDRWQVTSDKWQMICFVELRKLKKIFLYWFYYQHTSRDAVSPVCTHCPGRKVNVGANNYCLRKNCRLSQILSYRPGLGKKVGY